MGDCTRRKTRQQDKIRDMRIILYVRWSSKGMTSISTHHYLHPLVHANTTSNAVLYPIHQVPTDSSNDRPAYSAPSTPQPRRMGTEGEETGRLGRGVGWHEWQACRHLSRKDASGTGTRLESSSHIISSLLSSLICLPHVVGTEDELQGG